MYPTDGANDSRFRLKSLGRRVTLTRLLLGGEVGHQPLALHQRSPPHRRHVGEPLNKQVQAACDGVLALVRERLARVTLAEWAREK